MSAEAQEAIDHMTSFLLGREDPCANNGCGDIMGAKGRFRGTRIFMVQLITSKHAL